MKRIILDALFILVFIIVNIFLVRAEWRMFKETPHYFKLKRKWQNFKEKRAN